MRCFWLSGSGWTSFQRLSKGASKGCGCLPALALCPAAAGRRLWCCEKRSRCCNGPKRQARNRSSAPASALNLNLPQWPFCRPRRTTTCWHGEVDACGKQSIVPLNSAPTLFAGLIGGDRSINHECLVALQGAAGGGHGDQSGGCAVGNDGF